MSICVNSVLVAEALGDLVVAVEAGHHQQLLEELRALRQREEGAVVHAAGHEVVTRTLGRALGEHRRLDVDEAELVQELAHLDGHAVAQAQVLLHLGAAQVEHAVRQAHGLGQVLVVQRERRRDARVEHRQLVAQHLDLAADEAAVLGAGRAGAHDALDLQAELVAHALGGLEALGAVGVADDLHQALTVAQVDEDHAAVVAPAVGPTHQGDGLAHQRFTDEAAVGGSHGSIPVRNGVLGCRDGGGAAASRAHRRGGRTQARQGWPAAVPGQPGQFRAATATTGGGRSAGPTTPIEMTYFSASSTLMRSGTTSARGMIRKKPEVGLGVVGT